VEQNVDGQNEIYDKVSKEDEPVNPILHPKRKRQQNKINSNEEDIEPQSKRNNKGYITGKTERIKRMLKHRLARRI
jgi:hypothetical protein